MIQILAALIFTASSQFSPSAMSVEGVVTKFDDKIIQVKQKNGAVITVPRSSQKTMQGVKINKDVLKLKVESADFLRLNAHFFESKEASPATEKKQDLPKQEIKNTGSQKKKNSKKK